MLDKQHIGRKSEPRHITVEHGQLKLFAKATQETNPIYFDTDSAKQAGHREILAPLTFGNCLKFLAPSKELSYESLGIDYKRLLHAQESFEYFHPIYAGDRVTLTARVNDIFEKKNGTLQFMVLVTDIHRGDQALQKLTTTLVMKAKAA